MNIFLCYAHEDSERKEEFARCLGAAARGYEVVWSDVCIRPGEDWRRAIEDALRNSSIAFILISPHLFESLFALHVEIPAIQRREREGLLRVFPVVVRTPYNERDFERYFHFSQARPLGKDNRPCEFRHLNAAEQIAVADELLKEARQQFELMLHGLAVNADKLATEADRRAAANRLASAYSGSPADVAREVVRAYFRLWRRGDHTLARLWGEEVRKVIHADRVHDDLFWLLELGFPETPVHLDIIRLGDDDTLLRPDHATLFLGIRLTEENYADAEQVFQRLRVHDRFRTCALLEYAIGQCLRKKQHDLPRATVFLTHAAGFAKSLRGPTCACGPGCPRDALLATIRRGLGVTYRKCKEFDKAGQQFDLARKMARRGGVPPHVRADVAFGHGYFLFEWAIIESRYPDAQITERARERLRTAAQLFEASLKVNPRWQAPAARLSIVKQVLGTFDLPGYLEASAFSRDAGVETRLTKFLCEFAVLCHRLKAREDQGPSPEGIALYRELHGLFSGPKVVARAARECHAFDATVIKANASLAGDPCLEKAYTLLRSCIDWRVETLEDQQEALDEFDNQHPSPVC